MNRYLRERVSIWKSLSFTVVYREVGNNGYDYVRGSGNIRWSVGCYRYPYDQTWNVFNESELPSWYHQWRCNGAYEPSSDHYGEYLFRDVPIDTPVFSLVDGVLEEPLSESPLIVNGVSDDIVASRQLYLRESHKFEKGIIVNSKIK